jgi:DNA-directed RNA polymerase specialized sigma24 family protein
MPNDFEQSVLSELAAIKMLVARLAIGGLPDDKQVKVLTHLGFQPKDIAQIIGKSSNAVRQTKFRSKTTRQTVGKKKLAKGAPAQSASEGKADGQ